MATLNMDLPNDSPPAYEAPYTVRNGAPEKAQTLGGDHPSPECNVPTVDLKRIYPFHGLRWWIVGSVVKWLAWEPSNYSRNLFIAIENDGQDKLLVSTGLLDSGLFMTVLCRKTAERMEKAGATIKLHPNGRKPIFVTSNGTPFYSIGTIKARMKVDGGLRFVEREWEVSESLLGFTEALIGTDLMHELGRFVLFGAAGSPVVEAKPRTASSYEIQKAQQARAQARAANPARLNELRNNYLQGGRATPLYGAGTAPFGGGRQYVPGRR